MYLRIVQRHNREGLIRHLLRPRRERLERRRKSGELGRADQLDRAELERLVKSINRVLDDSNDAAGSATTSDRAEIEIERVFELGVVLAARSLWEELGIGAAIRRCAEQAKLTAPHETALFAMAANRLDDPVSKLACAERWLPDITWLPDVAGLAVDNAIARSWVLPGNTADVTTVARIKDNPRAWRPGRCLFVGDARMYSADNLAQLSRGLGRYILAVPMRRVRDIEDEGLTRPGHYQQNEVWVGDGERGKRNALCLNPQEAEAERTRRAQLLVDLGAGFALLEQRQEDHPKVACELVASRRYGRHLSEDERGRPRLDAAKVKAAEKFDGKFVVISNDDMLSAEDIALGYKGGWIIESCFRRIKQTGLQVRPLFHWKSCRIEAHVKLCVLALQVQRAAEILGRELPMCSAG